MDIQELITKIKAALETRRIDITDELYKLLAAHDFHIEGNQPVLDKWTHSFVDGGGFLLHTKQLDFLIVEHPQDSDIRRLIIVNALSKYEFEGTTVDALCSLLDALSKNDPLARKCQVCYQAAILLQCNFVINSHRLLIS